MSENILFLTNLLPFPGNSGGTIATKRSLDTFYNNNYNITLLFFSNNTKNEDIESFKSAYPKLNIWFINNENNKRSIKNLIVSLFKFIPLNIYRNFNTTFLSKTNSLLSEKVFDLIYCDHLEMFQYIPKSYHKKTILYEHNAEFMIWKRYAERLKNPIIKIPVFLESLRYKNYELKTCDKTGITLAAPNDLLILSEKSRNKDKFQETYHLGNDTMLYLPTLQKPQNDIHILFIGTMTWQANIDAIQWFENQVLPILTKKYPNIILDVVGKLKNDDLIKENKNPNIVYHGFVDSTEPFFLNSTVFVCPLQFGSGMKVKNIEALYRGIPLVTTTIGAESIDLENSVNAYITDDNKQFAIYITDLIEDSELWNKISTNARILANKKYTKKQAEEKMLSQINEIIKK